ncbi:hypothetical protein RF55_3518 [Lasius niger]|uniref:Uncharacterized protein n=1 Tax=Lasius niger TaxID=67767 RepID=A0A0J7NUZ4_LASNI|nr:hypothetical protein RF55_3518 [Lasius niger]
MYPEAYVKENVAKSMPEYRLEQRYQETRRRDEEIMLKMSVLEKLLSEDTDENDIESKNSVEDSIMAETSIPEETKRVVRQVRRHRPGFFYTLARVAFETFNDTRSAIQQISNIIGENFVPDTTARPPMVSSNSLQVNDMTTVATSSNDQNDLSSNLASTNVTTMRPTTTSQAPFRFTPTGLQDILTRNLRGLVRLFNIEWQDALNENYLQIPISTLEAVGTLVKTTTEQRQQNAERIRNSRQEMRERLMAIKEQKRKRKQEIQDQQSQLTRIVRHYHKDPLGLNAWSNLLLGHHAGGLLGHHSGLGGIHGIHGSHSHGIHGGHGNRPQHSYEVHEDVNEDTSFSWHGLTAGIGSFHGIRPSSTAIKIENKIAPQEKRQKVPKYPSVDVNYQNKITKITNKPIREYDDDSPIENKIAPRNGKVTFVR